MHDKGIAIDVINDLRAQLAAITAERDAARASLKQFLQDISDDMECLPTCDSTMHYDACPVAFPAAAWGQLRSELTAVKKSLRTEQMAHGITAIYLSTLKKKVEEAPKVRVSYGEYPIIDSGFLKLAQCDVATLALVRLP
jgi:hypothetical protein